MTVLEMERARQKLVEMRERLREEIQRRGQAIIDEVTPPGDISRVPTHNADHAMDGVDAEVAVGETQTGILLEVESALTRIHSGDYGRCQRCGQKIPEARLEAIPYAIFCIRCERKVESERAAR